MITYPDTHGRDTGSPCKSHSMQKTSSRKSRPMGEKDYRSFIMKLLEKARRTSHRHTNKRPFA